MPSPHETTEPIQPAAAGPDPRVRILRPGRPDPEGRCVVYWMQRAQRGKDNHALEHAVRLANELRKPLLVAFALTANYPGAQRRHYRFLVDGLPEVARQLAARRVGFVIRLGRPDTVIPAIVREVRPAIVVGDENPLRVPREWRERVASEIDVPFHLVDADVVVPSGLFTKDEWSARTLRIKLHKVWDRFFEPIENRKAAVPWGEDPRLPAGEPVDPDILLDKLRVGGVGEIPSYRGGPAEAQRRLRRFLDERLTHYAEERNEPTPYRTTELSAHLHFGHIGPLTIALAARATGGDPRCIEVLLEELIVRRELAVNFTWRNPQYDSLAGCPRWALETLARHRDDRRPHIYTKEQFEAAETRDPLWNAAQMEMVLTGRMHNYLRMYWAKKILEWTPDAETAHAIALDLNDRYEMDGRDPNGYEGVAWAIGGKHDRPWPERPIFGAVRFMSYESTRKKFDSASYIARVREIEQGRLFGDE